MTTAALRDALLEGRNADGGWGYYPGKASRLEATAWASLALVDPSASDVSRHAIAHWPSRDGLLLERSGGEPNFGFHGLALLALHACRLEHSAGNGALVEAVGRVKGIALEQSPYFRQDNSLQGWSWTSGTFSWVEPTAYCLLALKKWSRITAGRVDAQRIAEAERLLLDRACTTGGWNYGNSRVMDKDLEPQIPTTALALLAMQDQRSQEVIQRSLAYLEENALSERSATALALTYLALRVFDRPTDSVHAALIDQLPVTMALANHVALAVALYALRPDHADAAIRL